MMRVSPSTLPVTQPWWTPPPLDHANATVAEGDVWWWPDARIALQPVMRHVLERNPIPGPSTRGRVRWVQIPPPETCDFMGVVDGAGTPPL